MPKKIIIADVIAALLLLLFLYSAISKLWDRPGFEYAMAKSKSLRPFAVELSYAIPIIELIICGLLFMLKTRGLGVVCSFFLLSIFTVYLVVMEFAGKDKPCSCGGVISKLNWNQHIFFNSFFLLLSAGAMLLYFRKKKKDRLSLS